MKKTYIVYAALALHPAILLAQVTPAREAGQSVRLVGTDFFRAGEAETNAAAVVFVQREPANHVDAEDPRAEELAQSIADKDEQLFQDICATYPDLEVKRVSESDLKIPALASADDDPAPAKKGNDVMKDLREELIALGGSVPANASAAKLADLIAAEKAKAANA